jgi:hypothetical protein
VRRTQDAGAHCAHFEDGKAIAQLIFREIAPAPSPPRNFHARTVLLINGETYLRPIVSKCSSFEYFVEPGWRSNEWNFFRRICETECPYSAR